LNDELMSKVCVLENFNLAQPCLALRSLAKAC
jgi:hypothetical protein